MSPEVILGDRYTEACDVYSFALVLYEIASRLLPQIIDADGLPVHSNNMPFLVAQKGMRPKIPDDPENFPKDLVNIMTKGWAQDPDDRPSMPEMVKLLGAWKRTKMRRVTG